MFGFFKRKKKSEQNNLADQVSLGVNAGNLERHSEAGREFVKAFSGYDGTTGQNLKKGLSQISNMKLNPDPNYYERNVKQQAGFSAEVLDAARKNKNVILNGNSERYARVDDVAGHKTNETAFDITALDSGGNEIYDLSGQMKFLKFQMNDNGVYTIDTKDFSKVISGIKKENGVNFRDKYPEGKYIVPKDAFDDVKNELHTIEKELQKKYDNALKTGNVELQEKFKMELDYAKKVDKNLMKSEVTAHDAIVARLEPDKLTRKEIAKLGHEAGVNYAKSAAVIKGSMTFARCVNKVVNGEMTAQEAAAEITTETAKGAIVGYATGQANTALAAVMRNSSKEALRKLGSSSAPAQIVTFTTSVFRILNDRMEGKITDEECFHNIAKSGVGVIGTFKAGVVGEVAGKAIGKKIGGAVGAFGGPVGAIVGSVVAGVVIDATYDYAVKTMKAPEIARAERIQIEQQCEQLHLQLEEYREHFRRTYIANTNELVGVFGNSLQDMAAALKMNDADSFIMGANTITKALGGKTQFNTVDEFEALLDSDDAFDL